MADVGKPETAPATTTQARHDEKVEDTGAAVQLAHDVETEAYSPWTPRMFRLYLVLVVAYLCGCLNGYDGSLMGGLNGMKSYRNFFGM